MIYFQIDYCEVSGCRSWRTGDQCAKNGVAIKDQLAIVSRMHSPDICLVRKQANLYRLEEMLDER